MAKGILLIDIPKCCDDCPLLEYCHNNDGKCDLKIRQPWCPLKIVPNKLKDTNSLDEYETGFVDGWNNFIEENLENKLLNLS